MSEANEEWRVAGLPGVPLPDGSTVLSVFGMQWRCELERAHPTPADAHSRVALTATVRASAEDLFFLDNVIFVWVAAPAAGAGLLALGTYPQEYLPQLVVRAADLRDPDPRVRASNITTLDGPIPTLLTAAMAWLRTNLPTAVVESSDGSVRNVPQFPLEALRELVANALVHRDLSAWSEGMAVELRLDEHTLVLTNPGGLYGITVDRLGSDHVTSARNGRLVALCENVVDPSDGSRVIEALASGLPRVTRSLEDAALPPARYFDVGLRFTVILSTGSKAAGSTGGAPAGGEAAAVAGVRGLKSGSQLARVYQSLVDGGAQTVTEIAEATGIAGPSVRRALTRLREDYGYVESDGGPGRRTTYSVLLEPPAPAGARRV